MNRFNERLLVINSLICGHLLVLWAMVLNALGDHTLGVVYGATAIFFAWLLPVTSPERRSGSTGIAIGCTILSWIVAVFA